MDSRDKEVGKKVGEITCGATLDEICRYGEALSDAQLRDIPTQRLLLAHCRTRAARIALLKYMVVGRYVEVCWIIDEIRMIDDNELHAMRFERQRRIMVNKGTRLVAEISAFLVRIEAPAEMAAVTV